MTIPQNFHQAETENYYAIQSAIETTLKLSRRKDGTPEQKQAAQDLYNSLVAAIQTYLDVTEEK